MKKVRLRAAVAAALCALAPVHAAVQEKPSTLADQQSVAVTIYNQDLALLKDTRRVLLDQGQNRLALREVSGRMRPETAQLRSLTHPGSLALLEKYVGRSVRIVRTHPTTGAESVDTATVLAVNSGIGQKIKVGVFVQFENRESSHLGMPMPKGVVRVYKKDSAGNAQFIGEDRIDHTPKNENVRLKLGEAFEVTADKKQSDFKRRDTYSPWSYVHESAYEIALKNAKKESVTVIVREPVPGDWTMLEQSHRHAKAASGTAEWKIAVPAEGSATLRYRVLVRY